MQYYMYLVLPQRLCKYSVYHKSETCAKWLLCWCPKWIFKGLHMKIVSPLLNASRWMKTMHPRKNQMVIWRISNAPGEQQGSGSHCWLRLSHGTRDTGLVCFYSHGLPLLGQWEYLLWSWGGCSAVRLLLLPLARAIMPETIAFGIDMVGITRCGRGRMLGGDT